MSLRRIRSLSAICQRTSLRIGRLGVRLCPSVHTGHNAVPQASMALPQCRDFFITLLYAHLRYLIWLADARAAPLGAECRDRDSLPSQPPLRDGQPLHRKYVSTAAPPNGAIIEGNTGIGTSAPAHRFHVVGDVRFVGDFINQEVTGSNVTTFYGGPAHQIPYNATYYPINGTTVSITIPDGNGVDHSGVFISGFARIVNNTTMTGNQALAGYFLILVRAEDPAFTVNKTVLTYSSGICALRFPNGLGNTTTGFNMGSSVSYVDLNLTAGMTYYYRLELYGNHINVTGGTLDVHERNLSVLQIKR